MVRVPALRLILPSRLDLVLLFVLYDMAVKPDFGDASSILWGLAGAAVAVALLVRRYRVSLSQARAVAPAG